MPQYDVNNLHTELENIVLEAGRDILEFFNNDPLKSLSSIKNDQSPLTLADLASHKRIKAGLTQLTPEIPVLSEEDPGAIQDANTLTYWLVDPLDGTREFLAGSGEFTVNIALISQNRAIFGMVGVPAQNTLYWGDQVNGAFRSCNGTDPVQIFAHGPQPGELLSIVASKSHMDPNTQAFIRQLDRPYSLLQAGSSLKFCRIAEGSAHLYPRFGPTCEWDTAAAQAVLEAAGGFVSTLDGQPLGYGKPGFLNPPFIASSEPLAPFLSSSL